MRAAIANLILRKPPQQLVQYLLGPFRFGTDMAAPLASPYTEAGAVGGITKIDAGNRMSIASAALTAAGGAGTWNDPAYAGAALSRVVGRACLATVFITGGRPSVGFTATFASGSVPNSNAFYFNHVSTIGIFYSGGALVSIPDVAYASSTAYQAAVVLRSAGAYLFIRGGVFTNWTLLWVENTETSSPLYPFVGGFQYGGKYDDFRVLDLGLLDPRFLTDYGLATQRLVTPSAGASFAHPADSLLDFTITTLPSSGVIGYRFRTLDANNLWQLEISNLGGVILYERVAGTYTSRATAANSTIANGHRVVVVIEGSVIKFYSNNVLRFTYSSATNFQTATAGSITTLGTGGAVAENVVWPRSLSLPVGV